MEAANLTLRINTEGMNEAQRGMEGLTNTADMLEGAFRKVAAAWASWEIFKQIREVTTLAARYDTLGIAMNTAGITAGFSSAQMAGLQKSMEDTGISMLAARQSLVMMAAAQMDLGKSAELARVAQNVAIVAGLNSSQAFETLTQSIQTGQGIIAHHMGLMVNYEAAETRLARALGKTREQLTDSEKAQARMNEVMRLGAGYQGLYEAAMTTAGKQMKSMERYVENLQVKIGALFQPAFSAGVEFFTATLKDLAAWMDKASKSGDLQRVAGAIGSFTAGGLEAAVAPIKLMIEYSEQLKVATLAIGAAAAFAFGNQWIPALASMIAPTLRAVTLVVSMELATINYATSTGVAALAMAGFRGAMTALLSPMGLVTAGLAALYFATKSIREETERLNEASQRQEQFQSQVVDPILRLRSDAKSLRKQREALLADGGTPGIKTHEFQVNEIYRTTTEGMDRITPEWASNARMYAEQVVTAREALEKSKNDVLKQQQAMEAAARAAQDLAKAQAKFKEELTQTLARHMAEGTSVTAWEREQLDLTAKKLNLQKASYDLADAMVKLPTTEKMVPQDIINGPATEKSSFHVEKLTDSMTTLLRKMADAADSGNAFAAMGYEVVMSSGRASDALASWMSNTDGLGRSWTTLGNTVRNVLADMIRQMERAIIQQKLMDPLLQAAGSWIFNLGNPVGTSGVAPSGSTGMTFAAPPSGAGPQANIIVHVNSDGTAKATSQDAGKAGTDLAQMMEPVMNAWAIKQSRSGGLLAARG